MAGRLRSLEWISLADRFGNALIVYVTYLRKMVWPTDLAPYYPLGTLNHEPIQILSSLLILGGISAAAVLQWRRRPYVLVGWLWYLGTLVPVIGLVQVGSQAMADRYTYVPLIGIFVDAGLGLRGPCHRSLVPLDINSGLAWGPCRRHGLYLLSGRHLAK